MNDKQVHYSHYVEINHEAMYKALWDSGLRRCGNQRASRATSVDGVESTRGARPKFDFHTGLGLPPLQEGLPHGHGRRRRRRPAAGRGRRLAVHPALADSMLHLTAVAPKPPEGGWPWMSDDEKNGVVPGVHGLDFPPLPPAVTITGLRHGLAAGVLAGARAPRRPVAERSLQ